MFSIIALGHVLVLFAGLIIQLGFFGFNQEGVLAFSLPLALSTAVCFMVLRPASLRTERSLLAAGNFISSVVYALVFLVGVQLKSTLLVSLGVLLCGCTVLLSAIVIVLLGMQQSKG